MTTAASALVAAGIVMLCREDDAQRIIDKHASECEQIIAAIESGEVWMTVHDEWHRQHHRDFHKSIIDAWREPEWAPRPKTTTLVPTNYDVINEINAVIKLTPLDDDTIDAINADAAGRKIE